MKLNKKAEVYDITKEWIIWIVKAIIFFVVASMIIIIIYIPINSEFKVDGLQHSLLRQHLIYDSNCLAYEKDKVYPGIIDVNKFNQANLEKCFNLQDHGVQLTLKTNNINTIKLNEEWNKFEFCFDKKNFYCSNVTYYVLIQNITLEQATLDISIMNPR